MHAALHLRGDVRDVRPRSRRRRAPRPPPAAHACAPALLRVHARHLRGRVGGVAGQHFGRDHAVAFHQFLDRRTSSVASGRAKKRNGTNVVPRPGETCITVPSRVEDPFGIAAPADARAESCRSRTGARSGRRAGARRESGPSARPGRSRARAESGRAGSEGRHRLSSKLAASACASHVRGSTPANSTRAATLVDDHGRVERAASRASSRPISTGRENGSRESA